MICKHVYNKLGLSGTESECFHHMTTIASCVLGGLRSNKNGRKMTVHITSVTCHGSIWVSTSTVHVCRRGAMVTFASHRPSIVGSIPEWRTVFYNLAIVFLSSYLA